MISLDFSDLIRYTCYMKMRKGKQKDEQSFILPKCLESFKSCQMPKSDGPEGRELGRIF